MVVAAQPPDRSQSARERAAPTDEELAAAVAGGDEAAFAELFRRYRDRLHGFVSWHAGFEGAAPSEVEEVVQEVFFQLYRSLATWRGRSSFRTWLFGLAKNVCRHQRRRRGRRRRIERPAEELGPGEPTEVPDLAPGVLERLAAGELRREVRRRVATLPAIYREVLVLRDWEDLSYARIAEVTGVPVGTVRSRLHEARARLAAALGAGAKDAKEEADDGL